MRLRDGGAIQVAGWLIAISIVGLAIATGVILAGADSPPRDGRPFLGVSIEEETGDPEGGARVTAVVPDSAAERAGIRAGDVIRSVDGQVVRGPRGLVTRLEDRRPGDRVTVSVLRDGSEIGLDAELGEKPAWDPERWAEFGQRWAEHGNRWAEQGEKWAEWGERFGEHMAQLGERFAEGHPFALRAGSRPLLGVQLVEPTPELRRHLGGDESSGVLVSRVLAGMPAEDAGIAVGDLIVAVEDHAVSDSRDLARALGERTGRTFAVEVIRAGRRLALDVRLPDSPAPDSQSSLFLPPPAPPAPPALRMRWYGPPPPAPPAPVAPRPMLALPAPPAPPAESRIERLRRSV